MRWTRVMLVAGWLIAAAPVQAQSGPRQEPVNGTCPSGTTWFSTALLADGATVSAGCYVLGDTVPAPPPPPVAAPAPVVPVPAPPPMAAPLLSPLDACRASAAQAIDALDATVRAVLQATSRPAISRNYDTLRYPLPAMAPPTPECMGVYVNIVQTQRGIDATMLTLLDLPPGQVGSTLERVEAALAGIRAQLTALRRQIPPPAPVEVAPPEAAET